MKSNNVSLKTLPEVLANGLGKFSKHAIIVFFLCIALAYGFVLYRISTLSNATPSDQAVAAQTKSPHVNEDVINQLQQLNDNSVTVRTLFNGARNNPFNE